MPLLFEPPIVAPQVPHLDGVLITHIDNDHFSIPTCQHLKGVCKSFHAPGYVAEVMAENGLPGTRHGIGEKITVGNVQATTTSAWHNWQN
ncbi:MAG: MBL fold metallo-hydrolase, partial [Acutalibacter sp.]|nr:MBL fold metallo-hydrolase [Acutalibacter sp.]